MIASLRCLLRIRNEEISNCLKIYQEHSIINYKLRYTSELKQFTETTLKQCALSDMSRYPTKIGITPIFCYKPQEFKLFDFPLTDLLDETKHDESLQGQLRENNFLG